MSSKIFTLHAPSKINLFLHITGVRNDGYHLLESLVVFADFAKDIITIERSDRFTFHVNGQFVQNLHHENIHQNLVVQAHKMLENFVERPLPCAITLTKNIPVGAGLGGGSSDASSTIKGLIEFFNLTIPHDGLQKILTTLGADVPVCYHQKPSYVFGIGDDVRPAPTIPPLHILLVWPNVHTSTKDVFSKRTGNFSPPLKAPEALKNPDDLLAFLSTTQNDLFDCAHDIFPVIKDTKMMIEQQDGCLLARMTGSGSCVFGVFIDEESCKNAHDEIKHQTHWRASYGVIGG